MKISESRVNAKVLGKLIQKIEDKTISGKIAKEVFGGKPFTPKDWADAHKAGKIPANLPRYLQDIYDPDYRKGKKK